MAGLSYAFDANTETPQDVQRRRALAEAIMGRTMSPQNVGEGFGAIAGGVVANANNSRANQAEQAGRSSADDAFSRIVSGLTGGAGGYAPSGAPQTAQGATNDMAGYQNAIASIESAGSGDYAAIGPTHPELGRPLGKYQVMEANIGPWSRQALGREVSPEEFLASPEIQDAVFNSQFGSYVDQYGPEGAAQAWFGGPGGVGQLDRQDSLGTSIGDYSDRFLQNIPGGGNPDPGMMRQMPGEGQNPDPGMLAMPGGMGGNQPAPTQTAQAQQGPSLEELLMASQNPWLTDGQRSILNAMIEQQMAAPAQPEYDFVNIDGELVRTDATGGGVQSLGQFGIPEQGYRQLSPEEVAAIPNLNPNVSYQVGPDGRIVEIGGSGVTVNNNMGGSPELGKLSTDYGYVLDENGQPEIDPETGLPRAAPVPGSPAWNDAQQAEQQEFGRDVGRQRVGQTVLRAVTRGLELLPEINQDAGIVGGNLRSAAMQVRGTPEYNLNLQIQDFLSNVGLDKLQEMRENSPTGGALGQVPIQQQRRLEQVLGSFDLAQDPAVIEENLQQLNNVYLDIMFGSAEERVRAVSEGKMTQDQSNEIDRNYYITDFDQYGRRIDQPQQPAQSQPDNEITEGTMIESTDGSGRRMVWQNGDWVEVM